MLKNQDQIDIDNQKTKFILARHTNFLNFNELINKYKKQKHNILMETLHFEFPYYNFFFTNAVMENMIEL